MRLAHHASARERCPYCHDSLGDAERVACAGCGTPHHPACLAELGGCTVLGCSGGAGGVAPQPSDPVEEIRRRVQERAQRFTKARVSLPEPAARVRSRLASQPGFCTACEREVRLACCPVCDGPVLAECAGDSVHCGRAQCRLFYQRLQLKVGDAIEVPQRRLRLGKLTALSLVLSIAVLAMLLVLVGLLTGTGWDALALPLVLLLAGAAVFGPLFVMMWMADRRNRDR